MRISREQLEALQDSLIERANLNMAEYARRRFPEATAPMPGEALLKFVRNVRERARRHAIVDEPDVATALDLSVMYGQDFYTMDWACDVFLIEDWSGSDKLDIVRERVRRQVPDF